MHIPPIPLRSNNFQFLHFLSQPSSISPFSPSNPSSVTIFLYNNSLQMHHHHCNKNYNPFLLLLHLHFLTYAVTAPPPPPPSCPYDLPYAAQIMPRQCYANATTAITGAPSPSTAAMYATVTSCCWFVFASYLYAAIRYSNATGTAFLPPSTASRCTSAYTSYLIREGLVVPSLLLVSDRCDLSGGPVRFAAGPRPCQFSTVSAVLSTVNLAPARRNCSGGPPYHLTTNQPACVACQNAVISAVFALLDATHSKEIVACGMAATMGIWSSTQPEPARFRSYALCLVQVLENVGNLGTANLLPAPPPPPPSPPGNHRVSRSGSSPSVKIIAAGSAALGVLVSLAVALVGISYYVRKKRRRSRWRATTKLITTTTSAQENPTGFSPPSPLPEEGLYIFTKSELKQATNGYDPRLVLGEGGSGKVYLGKLPSGQLVAIKRICKRKKLDEFYREVEVLAKLRHRNLTTLLGYCLQEKEHLLVYEYMPGGNLSKALYHGDGLTWPRRLRVALDVAEGLAYLHDLPDGAVVHRDVKPTNILLTEAGRAKLSDFGVSRVVPAGEGDVVSTEVRGTRGYVDPEYFAAGQVTEGADVYSYGVVLLELVTGMRAVVPTVSGGAESIVQRAHAAVAGGGEAVDGRILGEGWDRGEVTEVFELACRCVRLYRNERPRMREVVAVLRRALAAVEEKEGGGNNGGIEVEQSEVEGSEKGSPPFTSPSVRGWSI